MNNKSKEIKNFRSNSDSLRDKSTKSKATKDPAEMVKFSKVKF